LNKIIFGKEFSFFNISLQIQQLQSRAVAQGYLEEKRGVNHAQQDNCPHHV
jgi:hypothetical protein